MIYYVRTQSDYRQESGSRWKQERVFEPFPRKPASAGGVWTKEMKSSGTRTGPLCLLGGVGN